jgi:sigma-E factor negative regulatory protein RseB
MFVPAAECGGHAVPQGHRAATPSAPRAHLWVWVFAWALALGFSALVRAQTVPERRAALTPPKDAQAWLSQVRQASVRSNFQGTFVVSVGGSTNSARIVQYWQSGDTFQRIEPLDGQPRRVYRHNDQIQVQWPESKTVWMEQKAWSSSFPAYLVQPRSYASPSQSGRLIPDFSPFYEVEWLGSDRVAGWEAWVVALKPRDPFRYGYRVWTEAQSGLLLRAELLSHQGEVLTSSGFSEVSLDVKPQAAVVLQGMRGIEGFRVQRPRVLPAQLEQEGWVLRSVVPGFVPLHVVKRSLQSRPQAPDAQGEDTEDSDVLQAVFSDGLSALSVFIEPYRPEHHPRPSQQQRGPTHTLTRRQGEWWFTAVGDVPPATLRAMVQAFDRRP